MSVMSGGSKLQQHLDELAKKVAKAAELKVGFLEGATYPDGTPVATVAAIQNFGAPAMGIPPRPFFTDMIRRYRGTWGPLLGALLKKADYDATVALERLGSVMAGELRQQIVQTVAPPLSPVTVMLRSMRKGSSTAPITFSMVMEARRRVAAGEKPKGPVSIKPLVDSGHLLASVEYIVDGQTFTYSNEAGSYVLKGPGA
jgi:hypothetical protein